MNTRIDRWRRSLLDLTLRNRLLDARDGRTSVAIGSEPVELAARLERGEEIAIASLGIALAPAELERSVVAMARAAREAMEEGGAQALWIALGLYRWVDAEGGARHAPLVLWPVELRRVDGKYVVVPGEEPKLNETLIEKLREDGVTVALPEIDDELDIAAVLDAFATRGEVVRAARLGIFSFTKVVMWNDLESASLLDSALCKHLADGGGHAFPTQGEFPPLGEELAPEDTFCPLDADATQLAAVRAAEVGRTFVLQGPPGTGKSQTISNLIAQCLARGQRVLFVSEKMAALEVVQRRLAGAGLGDFCLELHSRRSKKRAVLDELGRVLERSWRPAGGIDRTRDDEKLVGARRALDDYARALHAPTALGVSVGEALARLIALRGTPRLEGIVAPTAPEPGWLAARRDALAEYAGAWRAAGGDAAHPWRDSALAEWQLSTGDAVAAVLSEMDRALAAVDGALAEVTRAVAGIVRSPDGSPTGPRTAAQIHAIGALAEVAARSPRAGGELLMDTPTETTALVTNQTPRNAQAWLALARKRRELVDVVESGWRPALLEEDGAISDEELETLAARFRAWGMRFPLWRWFALRKARARLGAFASGELPPDIEIADELEAALVARRAGRRLKEAEPAVKRWLGAVPSSDLDKVEAALAWAVELRAVWQPVGGDDAAWRSVVVSLSDNRPLTGRLAHGEPGVPRWDEVHRAVEHWKLTVERMAQVCGIKIPEEDPVGFVRARFRIWSNAIGALRDWTAYVRTRRAIEALGLSPVAAACERGELAPELLAPAWERALLLGWADAQMQAQPALKDFHGARHHARVVEFGELDRQSFAIARARLITRLAERVPKVSASDPAIADDGEIGILLHELKKQRRHKPLRALFARIPTLLGRLKPCMLMSPLSVAQYLDPSLPPFDLVVFDEASQIPTADAIGALARGASAVIVGDSKQLPPTRFFDIQGGGEDAIEEEYEELESVLDECVAARLPELRLGWHYRSRHEDLIAFSNRHYYGDALAVFPTPSSSVPDLGVAWRKVAGVYDRAGTRTNLIEAEAVVAEVLARAGQKRSIGVVTFSRAQQGLIEDLLDAARAKDPALDAAFTGDEPILVKNLETIQGDERDVVLFSIGYGPDAAGKITMNFGPLGQDGGERRLNVAVTRAREQLVVFSSLEPEDIIVRSPDGSRSADVTSIGVRHLGELLAYAKAGGAAAIATATPPSSPLVEAVAAALTARGWTVRTGIGSAAYRLDLAIVDPDDPGRYILAIECDGASYAAAHTARDRDRLRAQVLTQLGWRLHRIWSLDWWHDPEKEAQRANSAVIAAIAASRQGSKKTVARPSRVSSGPVSAPVPVPVPMPVPVPDPMPTLTVSGPVRTKAEQGRLFEARAIVAYRAASIPAGRRTPDDLHEVKYEPELGKVIDQVLDVEAPMHIDLLARRVGAYFGIGRVTSRVTDRIREVTASRARLGDPADTDAVWRADQDPATLPPVRAAESAAESRREADEIPLAEVAAAAALVLDKNLGMPIDDLTRETARVLGFSRLGDRGKKRMRAGIDLLASRGGCTIDGARASVAS